MASPFAALGRQPAIRFIEMPPTFAGYYQNFTQADMAKLRAAGYNCAPTTLEYGALATVEWLRHRERT